MKKFLALLLVLVMALGLVACSVEQANNGGSNTTNNTQNDTTNNTTDDTTGDTTGEAVEISLWTYPIGDWGKPEVVSEIIAKFNEKYPNITVTHQLLDYSNGDAQVNTLWKAAPWATSSWKVLSVWCPTGAPTARWWT